MFLRIKYSILIYFNQLITLWSLGYCYVPRFFLLQFFSFISKHFLLCAFGLILHPVNASHLCSVTDCHTCIMLDMALLVAYIYVLPGFRSSSLFNVVYSCFSCFDPASLVTVFWIHVFGHPAPAALLKNVFFISLLHLSACHLSACIWVLHYYTNVVTCEKKKR